MKQIAVLLMTLAVFASLQVVSPEPVVAKRVRYNFYESTQYGWPFAAFEVNEKNYWLSGKVPRYKFILESAVANLLVCVYVSLQTVTFLLQVSRKRITATLAEFVGVTLSIAVVASLYQSRGDLYWWWRETFPLDLHWLAQGNGFAAYVGDIVGCAMTIMLVMIMVDFVCACATYFGKLVSQPAE